MPLENLFGDLALDDTQQAILAELLQKLESGGTISINPADITNLKTNSTVTVMNPGATEPTLTLVKDQLAAMLTELAQKLEPGGAVSLTGNVTLDPANVASLITDTDDRFHRLLNQNIPNGHEMVTAIYE